MKILLTAFEPFDNNETNCSIEVLNKIIPNDNLIKEILPVEYIGSFLLLKELINKHQPNIIIMLGEARSYNLVTFEKLGINEYSNRADNRGYIPTTKKIENSDIDAIFSTLDYALFEQIFNKINIKQAKSYFAGTYVCNSLLYKTLLYTKLNNLNINCGFIHIPEFNKQPLNDIVKGLNSYILSLLN